ncbi:MAG: 3-keto-disaccharide hydrolase [Planctomycetota bacterium]
MAGKSVSIVCTVLLFLSSGCGRVDEDDKKSAAHTQKGFIRLFNGKDLAGWKPTGRATWVVKNGTIVGTQGPNNAPGDLLTENTYKDFLLTVNYKVEWPCNSGVWFRYQSPQKAYQADILEYKRPECYSGTLYCPGKMFLAMNTDKTLVNRDGWNTISVRAEGNRLQIWINGHQVADVRDDTSDSGHIGFQIHAGDQLSPNKIIVREVLLKPL